MKQQIPIKRFEYCTPDPGMTAGDRAVRGSRRVDIGFRLITLDIDFEGNVLSLEGILRGGKGARKSWWKRSRPDGEFIKVSATIFSGPGSSVSGAADDGVILYLDGFLGCNKTIRACKGLLVLDSGAEKRGWDGGEWLLSVYLCDDYNQRREISLNMTMLPPSGIAWLN